MEYSLVDSEEGIYIKNINGINCLHYKIDYPEQNFFKDNRFKKWLNEEIKKKGKTDYIFMCTKCNIFAYLSGNDEIMSFYHCNDSSLSSMKLLCLYCRKTFSAGKYCCARRGIISDFQDYLLDGCYSCIFTKNSDLRDCIKSIPFIFNLIFIGTIFYGLFLHRKIKVGNDKYINYEIKGTKLSGISIVFAALFFLIHSFVYFFSFSIIYFIYLIIFCKRKKKYKYKN